MTNFQKYPQKAKLFSLVCLIRIWEKKLPLCKWFKLIAKNLIVNLNSLLALCYRFLFVNLSLVSRKWEVKITHLCLFWLKFDSEMLIFWKSTGFYEYRQKENKNHSEVLSEKLGRSWFVTKTLQTAAPSHSWPWCWKNSHIFNSFSTLKLIFYPLRCDEFRENWLL